MKTIEEEKRGLKRIIKIQLVIMAILITVGGIVYGISTGKWPTAFMAALTLQSIFLLLAPMTYMTAVNRLEKFSDHTN